MLSFAIIRPILICLLTVFAMTIPFQVKALSTTANTSTCHISLKKYLFFSSSATGFKESIKGTTQNNVFILPQVQHQRVQLEQFWRKSAVPPRNRPIRGSEGCLPVTKETAH